MFWAWMKEWLRTAKARTREAIDREIAYTWDELPEEIAEAWCAHCGYLGLRN